MHIRNQITLFYHHQRLTQTLYVFKGESEKVKYRDFFKCVYIRLWKRRSHFVACDPPRRAVAFGSSTPTPSLMQQTFFLRGCAPFLLCHAPSHFKSLLSSLKASTVGSDVRINQEARGDSVMAVAPRRSLSPSVCFLGISA